MGNKPTSEIDSALMSLWHMNKTTATSTEAAWVLCSSCETMGLPREKRCLCWKGGKVALSGISQGLSRVPRGPLAPTNSPVDLPQITVSLTAGGSSSLEVERFPHLLFFLSDFIFCPWFSSLLCSSLPVCRWYIRMHFNKSLGRQCPHTSVDVAVLLLQILIFPFKERQAYATISPTLFRPRSISGNAYDTEVITVLCFKQRSLRISTHYCRIHTQWDSLHWLYFKKTELLLKLLTVSWLANQFILTLHQKSTYMSLYDMHAYNAGCEFKPHMEQDLNWSILTFKSKPYINPCLSCPLLTLVKQVLITFWWHNYYHYSII